MNNATGPSPGLEQVGLDGEPAAPGSPVVVIQYRDRGRPLSVLIPLVLIVAMTVIFLYHRLVEVRYRAEAFDEMRTVARAGEVSSTVEPAKIESTLMEPLALNSQPIVPGTIEPADPKPAALASSSLIAVTTTYQNPRPTTDAVAIPADPLAPGLPTRAVRPARIASALTDVAPSPAAGGSKARPGADPTATAEATRVAEDPDRQDTRNGTAPIPAQATGQPTADVAPIANEMVGAAENDPLPTKEESDRQLEEEARKKQAEIDSLEARQLSAVREMRQRERLEFRAELREILQIHGNRAGIEIDKLCKRNAYDSTSDQFLKAREMWRFSRLSTVMKVRYIRSLGLPEVAILNFLSDLIHLRIGTRDGPRDRNEVRIRAARALLKYGLPGTDVSESTDAGQPVAGTRGIAKVRPQGAAPSSSGVNRRSQ